MQGLELIQNIYIDGEKVENVVEYQITHSAEQALLTVRYNSPRGLRVLTCGLEAVSFDCHV